MMDADTLLTFAAVARAGGITRAAQVLNTVQSNVTAKVKQLEEELGVPLFQRHSRGVTLTPAGAQLLPYADRIGHLLAEARRAATDAPEPAGELCIGSMETTAALRLPPILRAYAGACPGVDVILQTGTSQALTREVLDRRLEGALVAGPVDHPDLLATPVVEEELVLVTAPWVSRPEILGEAPVKILVFRAGCSYRARLEALLTGLRIPTLRRLELGTLEGIIGCVAAGLGVTLLPRAVVAAQAQAGLVALHALPPPGEARVSTMFIRRRDGFASHALTRFLECCLTSNG